MNDAPKGREKRAPRDSQNQEKQSQEEERRRQQQQQRSPTDSEEVSVEEL
jgi:hypothetical protein